jgi:glycosyltransferase involved in cell wall biosynthesis
MRLAYFCPAQLPEAFAYDRALLPALAHEVEVERFVQTGALPEVPAAPMLPTFEETAFAERHDAAPYDLPIYQVGDDPAYRFAVETLSRRPGIVDLHSLELHRLYGDQPAAPAYEHLLAEGYGEAGRDIARYRAQGLPGALPDQLMPLGWVVAARGLGAVVHTREALASLQNKVPALPAVFVRRPLAMEPPANLGEEAAIRQRLGLRPEGPVITSSGVLPLHRRGRLVRAYSRLLQDHPGVILLLAAEDRLDASLWEELLRSQRLLGAARIVEVGASTAALVDVLAVTAVGLYLCRPALGEMPELPLRFMAAGKPTVLMPGGGLAEFPEDCCAYVEPGPPEEDLLYAYLRLLCEQPEVRQRLGTNAREYVAQAHAPAAAAQEYHQFLEEVWQLLEQRRVRFPSEEQQPVDEGSARPGQEEPASLPEGPEEKVGEIDVEQIMREIRLHTGEKYLTEQPPLPTFGAYRPGPVVRSAGEREMFQSLGEANRTWELPEPGARGELLSYLLEVVRQQTHCNASLVRTLNRLAEKVYDPARDVELTSLRYELAALQQRLLELERGLPGSKQQDHGDCHAG